MDRSRAMADAERGRARASPGVRACPRWSIGHFAAAAAPRRHASRRPWARACLVLPRGGCGGGQPCREGCRMIGRTGLGTGTGEDWPQPEPPAAFVLAGGLRWHVQVMGQEGGVDPAQRRPVILLLHGMGASTHSWRDLAPLLASGYTLVAPDLPGHGFTGHPPVRPDDLRRHGAGGVRYAQGSRRAAGDGRRAFRRGGRRRAAHAAPSDRTGAAGQPQRRTFANAAAPGRTLLPSRLACCRTAPRPPGCSRSRRDGRRRWTGCSRRPAPASTPTGASSTPG